MRQKWLFHLILFLAFFNAKAQPFLIRSTSVVKDEPIRSMAWFTGQMIHDTAFFSKGSKVELGISLSDELNAQVQTFFSNSSKDSKKLNPFNRHDLSLEAEFYSNGTLIQRRSGFYYEAFKRDLRSNRWIPDTTSFGMRIRFEAPQSGEYFVRILLKTKYGHSQDTFLMFKVNESSHQGFLEVGQDGKHMKYSGSGKSFHGIGQDIPWTSWEDWYTMDKAVGPKKFDMIHKALEAFDKAQGNFTRFVAAPWFMQLEWEALGNYKPKMGQAWEFDRVVDFCDKNEIYFLFCALMHGPVMSKPDDKEDLPGIRWEKYCYNDLDKTPASIACEAPIGISKAIEFYSHPKSRDHMKNYFRYLSARYGYSSSLAGWQLMSEVDETAEYRDAEENGKWIDHSENRRHVREWTDELSRYLRYDLTDRHLISISMITGKNFSKTLWDPEIFNLPCIDYTGFHDYMFEAIPSVGKVRNRNLLSRYYSVTELNTGYQNGSLSYPEYQHKPFIYDEFGHILTVQRKIPEDDKIDPTKDFNNCADFMIKQDLWFTFASGCAVAGLDWWNQDESKRYEMWRKYYLPLMEFMRDIDYESVNYSKIRTVNGRPVIAQRWPLTDKKIRQSTASFYRKDDLLEAYMQVSEDKSQGFGWMQNRSVHWYNLVDEYPCLKSMLNGTDPYHVPYIAKPQEDDLQDRPIDIPEETYYIRMLGLKKRCVYSVSFRSTSTGKPYSIQNHKTNRKGELKIYAPKMDHVTDPDIAFKVLEFGKTWR